MTLDAAIFEGLTGEALRTMEREQVRRYAELLVSAFSKAGDPRLWSGFAGLQDDVRAILAGSFAEWSAGRGVAPYLAIAPANTVANVSGNRYLEVGARAPEKENAVPYKSGVYASRFPGRERRLSLVGEVNARQLLLL